MKNKDCDCFVPRNDNLKSTVLKYKYSSILLIETQYKIENKSYSCICNLQK